MSETAGLPTANAPSVESAAATAAALAAKLNEQLQKKSSTSTSDATEQPVQSLPTSVEDALARAREVAARLAPGAKRGREDEAGANSYPWSKGEKHEIRRKIPIPQGHPDIDFQRVLIGPRGSNQKRMENESGARVYIRGRGSGYKDSGNNDQDDENEDPHVLIIADSQEAVDRAETLVREIIDNPDHAMEVKRQQLLILNEDKPQAQGMLPPQNPYANQQSMMEGHVTDSFTVSYTLAGSIIGRGGEMVMSLSNRSGAKVQVLKAGEMNTSPNERMVIITGPQAAVKEARRLIDELIAARGGGDRRRQLGATNLPVAPASGNVSIPLPVPEDKVGAIIGKQGQTIHHIQSTTGCHIEIPKERAPLDESGKPPPGATRMLTISGPTPDAVEAARMAVMRCVNPEAAFLGAKTINVPIEDSKAGLVIGKGGSTIKELQARTGTKVQVSQQPGPDGMRSVEVSGTPAGCEQAREMILNIVAGKLVLPPKDGRGATTGQMGGMPMAANPAMSGMTMPYAAGWDMSMHGYNPYAYASMQMPMYGGAAAPYGMGATQGHDASASYYANTAVPGAASGVGAHATPAQYGTSTSTAAGPTAGTTSATTASTASADQATTMEDFILQLAKQHGVDYAKSAIEHYRTMGYQIGEVDFSSVSQSGSAGSGGNSGTPATADNSSGTSSGQTNEASLEGDRRTEDDNRA